MKTEDKIITVVNYCLVAALSVAATIIALGIWDKFYRH